ncbi:MAG: transglutaminase domain-containing protein [Actinobacteria bacterium]|nr:transglutaminase domain-containing protein [Actinomycetota bacterium]
MFRLQGRFANALPVAASPVSVRADGLVFQRPDGSLFAARGFGRGAVYSVDSRQPDASAVALEQDRGAIPPEVSARYARPARTTDRVRNLAESIAGSSQSQFAKIRALEGWMGQHLTYSIDAPLAPKGVDVVDDFLFTSKVGWCEQIASSLVVMLREVGVPARLATGFAPGEADRSSGRFIVRERDAHAWTEVWFAGIGWVPFDPTAAVPFAGDPSARQPAFPIGFPIVAVVLLLVAAAVLVSAPAARRWHLWRGRRARAGAARRLAAERWDVRVEHELEELGREVGRPRVPSETVSTHARDLAAVTGRPELAEQGAAVDEHRYAPPRDTSG